MWHEVFADLRWLRLLAIVEGGFRVGVDGGWEMAGSLDPDGHGEGK